MTVSVNRYVIPATGLRIQTGGNFLFLMDSERAVDLEIIRQNTVSGRAAGIGSGFRYGPAAVRFDELMVTPVDGQPGSIQLAISEDPVDYRAPSGHVDVSGSTVQNTRARDLGKSGQAFAGGGVQALGLPGAELQLWNPAGSGVDLILSRVQVSLTDVVPAKCNVRLSTALVIVNPKLFCQIANKLVGGPDAVAEVYRSDAVSVERVPLLYWPSANGDRVVDLSPNIVIPPAAGIVVVVETPDLDGTGSVAASFEWSEEAV